MSRLVSTATTNADAYCLRYLETELGRTTLNSNGIVAAKKSDSSTFNNHRSEDFLCKIASTQTQRSSRSGVPNRGILWVKSLRLLIISKFSAAAFPLFQRVLSFLLITVLLKTSFLEVLFPSSLCTTWARKKFNKC